MTHDPRRSSLDCFSFLTAEVGVKVWGIEIIFGEGVGCWYKLYTILSQMTMHKLIVLFLLITGSLSCSTKKESEKESTSEKEKANYNDLLQGVWAHNDTAVAFFLFAEILFTMWTHWMNLCLSLLKSIPL